VDHNEMKRVFHMKKLVFAAWVLCAPVLGAPAWPADELSFEDSIGMAARQNPSLRGSRADLTAAEHDVARARAGFLPQVSASAGYTDATDGRASSRSNSVTASQNLFAGFQDDAKLKQAHANRDSTEAALVQTKAQLSHDLKSAYAGLLYAQRNVELTEDIRRRVEENLRLVQLRFESGRENKGSLLQTRASMSQARLDEAQAQQDLNSAQAELGRIIGRPDEEWRASGAIPINEPAGAPDFAALARGAPSTVQADARQRAADQAVRVARASYFPSVDVRATRSHNSGDDIVNAGTQNNVGASLSIPIFSGGRDYHGERSALAAADAAKAQSESVQSDVLVALRRAYAGYLQAVEQVKLAREFLDAAEVRASIARAQYQNGLASFSDWDRIESELTQRQKESLIAQRDRVTAEAAWELAQGKGVFP
jgi:outer membrane protein TolC